MEIAQLYALAGYQTKTLFGGIMTLLMIFGLTGYLVLRLFTIYRTREYEYQKRDLTYKDHLMNNMNITLGRFNDSLNFFFGLTSYDPNFDILNNPYVSFHGYRNS